jgi:hypothetical protein
MTGGSTPGAATLAVIATNREDNTMTTPDSRRATLVTRAGTADALDQAVRELTGSDGSGHGTLYALAGCNSHRRFSTTCGGRAPK